MRKNILILLILIGFISGCAGIDSATSTGSGIKLESFEFNPSIINDNMKTTASLTIKNTGDFDAENVKLVFFGLSKNQWDVKSSVGTDGTISLDSPVEFKKIRAKDKDKKIPLQKKKITLVLENTESLEKDIVYDYNIVARICYPYETVATTKVETITDDEFLILTEQNKFRQYPVTMDVSKGPIYVKITSKQPQIVSTDNYIHLKLQIRNIGGGTAMINGNCDNILNPTGDLNSLVEKLNKIEFDKAESDCELENLKDNKIYLKQGKSREIDIKCEVSSSSRTEHNLKLKFNYDYYFDSKKINVKVKGTKSVPIPKKKKPEEPTVPSSAKLGTYSCDEFRKYGMDLIEKNIPMKSIHTDIKNTDDIIQNAKISGIDVQFLFKKISKFSGETICDRLEKKRIGEYAMGDLRVSDTGLLELKIDDIDQLSEPENFVTETQQDFYDDLNDAVKDVEKALNTLTGYEGNELKNEALKTVDAKYRDLIDANPETKKATISKNAKFGIAKALGEKEDKKLSELKKINNLKPSCNKGDKRSVEYGECFEAEDFANGKIASLNGEDISKLTDNRVKSFKLDDFYINKLKNCGFLGLIYETDYADAKINKDYKRTIGCLKDIPGRYPVINTQKATDACNNLCSGKDAFCTTPAAEEKYFCSGKEIYSVESSFKLTDCNCVCYSNPKSLDKDTEYPYLCKEK